MSLFTLQLETEAQTHHSRALLFDILTDWEKVPTRFRWIQHVEKCTPGPTRVGTELTQFMSLYGIRNRALLTVDELDPPSGYSLRITNGKKIGSQRVHLSEKEGETEIQLRSESSVGLLELLIWPVMRKSAALFCEDFIEDLVAAADSIEPYRNHVTGRP